MHRMHREVVGRRDHLVDHRDVQGGAEQTLLGLDRDDCSG